MDRQQKFMKYLDGIKTDTNAREIEFAKQGFKRLLEGHAGFDRTIDRIANEAGLEYTTWDNYLKKEMGASIKNIIYPREVLGFMEDKDAQRALTAAKTWIQLLNSINYEFSGPSVMQVKPSDFSRNDADGHEMILTTDEGRMVGKQSPYNALRSRLFTEMRVDADSINTQ